jgi:hypothetical protein
LLGTEFQTSELLAMYHISENWKIIWESRELLSIFHCKCTHYLQKYNPNIQVFMLFAKIAVPNFILLINIDDTAKYLPNIKKGKKNKE